MSWYRSYESLDKFETDEPATVSGTPPTDVLHFCRQAVVGLIEAGVVGDKSAQDFFVSVSGHTNPGRVPTHGMANDSVNISITQKERKKEPIV